MKHCTYGRAVRAGGCAHKSPIYLAEVLEKRLLFSQISWMNRGMASDNFASTFGVNAGAARTVVDAAVTWWQRIIQNFNYSGGSNTFTLSLQEGSSGVGFGGSSNVTGTIGGKPSAGSATLGRGNDVNNDGLGDGDGYYIDPTPNDYFEFQDPPRNGPPNNRGPNEDNAFSSHKAELGFDLFNLAAHEIGHCLGLGPELAASPYMTNTGKADNVEIGTQLWAFNGPSVTSLWTSSNSGAPNPTPFHVAIPEQNVGSANAAIDLMISAYGPGERRLPSNIDGLILHDAYNYTITMPEQIGNFQSNLNTVSHQLVVRGGNFVSDDVISISSSGSLLNVSVNLGTDAPGTGPTDAFVTTYNNSDVTSIAVYPGDGNDTIILTGLGSLGVNISDSGGTADSLTMQGLTGNVTVGRFAVDVNGGSTFLGSMEYLTLGGSAGNENFFVNNFPDGPTFLQINGGDGDDTLNIAPGGVFQAIRSPITFDGGPGNDTVNLAPDAPFGADSIAAPFTFTGGADSDTLNMGSGNLDVMTALVTFNGVSGGNDRIVLNDQVPNGSYSYNVTPTSITRNPLFGGLNFSNTDDITLSCGPGANTVRVANAIAPLLHVFGNDGGDNFIVGGGNLTGTFPQIFDGGNGTDQITFDDHLDPTARFWDVRPGEVIFGGLISLFTNSFESVGVLAGTNGDEITFAGAFTQNLNISGGGGSNTFQWNAATNYYPLTGDLFAMNLDGGAGLNQLVITQANQGPLTFNVTEDQIYAFGDPFDIFASRPDVNYTNFISVTVTTGPQDDRFNVYDTRASSNYALNGGDGADYFYMQTDPAQRNSVGINGQAGSDTLFVDDSVRDGADVPYTVNATSVVRNTGPLSITTYGYTSIQSLIVVGSPGPNTFDIAAFNPNGPLAVYGGAGNDVLNVNGAVVGLSPSNRLSFNGDDDYDTFNMLDATASSTAYNLFSTLLRRNSTDVPISTAERININAGPSNDDLIVYNQDPGQLVSFFGGNGNDRFMTGALSADGVRGLVQFYGEGGADNRVLINDIVDTTGDTVHIDQTTVGAFPGDTLFGPGGSLFFAGVQRLDLNLGSGDDTVLAQPNAVATLNLNLGAQSASQRRGRATGDTLDLALATAQNYVITPGAAGAGTVTSDNLQPLNYTGVEEGPIVDDVAPTALSGEFLYDGVPAQRVGFTFDEDVSLTMSPGYFYLTNLNTGLDVSPAVMSLAYDTATNVASVTFPGLPNGTLGDGNYHANLVTGYTDLFGNASTTPLEFDFFFLNGDANHDRVVDVTDLGILATNWQTSGRTFSEGDVTYDGVVDVSDLGILATNWQQTLPPPTGSRQPKIRKPTPFAKALALVGLESALPRAVRATTALAVAEIS